MSEQKRYDFGAVESKWSKVFREKKLFNTDLDNAKKPFYNLMMFPYPSAEGLHVGNCFAFIGTDIYGRYKRMQGFDVFEPMGFDAFGIHSENYALKVGKHPKKLTEANINNFKNQLAKLGLMIDWERLVDTTKKEYYRWTQWIFLQLYKNGLAEKRQSPVNWCPSCNTVLADSQIISGACERCDTAVTQKNLSQWFFKITKYAERLLKNLDNMDWSEIITAAQRRKIGYSEGAFISFKIDGTDEHIEIFTTRPDTIFGVTYLVLAPEHPLVERLTTVKQKDAVSNYIKQTMKKTRFERAELVKDKTGVFTGAYVLNPVNGKKAPLWIADYVLMDYGTGAVMAVPAHDSRDFEFANKMSLPITQVISQDGKPCSNLEAAYEGTGLMLNSEKYNGMRSEDFKQEITKWFDANNCGKLGKTYRLRDWCISRQRFWGPPIPIVYCEKCGTVPVPEKDLPVFLPDSDDYIPDGTNKSPLARNSNFVKTTCPTCGGNANRETDVSDNFLDSAWYYLRYLSTDRNDAAFDGNRMKRWLPIESYTGGKEHAEGHLLYFRFITMALHDMGFVPVEEPVKRFRAHGVITKDGAKMSKSKGNVVNPDEYIEKYGADVLRLYLMFIGPFDMGGDFNDSGINGCKRFLDNIYMFLSDGLNDKAPDEVLDIVNQSITKVANGLETLSYNTAIAQLMTLYNVMKKEDARGKTVIVPFLKLLHPFAPFITQELWHSLGLGKDHEYILNERWPVEIKLNLKKTTVLLIVQVNGKLRDKLTVPIDLDKDSALQTVLKSDKVNTHVGEQAVKSVVYVPNKLINIVV